MSTRKARLIKPNNFNINSYYNTYSNKQTIKNNFAHKEHTLEVKNKNYLITNNRSLRYSSIFKNFLVLCSKKRYFSINFSYPLYMQKFLIMESNYNYNNSYDSYYNNRMENYGLIYNRTSYGFNVVYGGTSKFWLYKKQSRYFNSIYKHYYRHFFEHEDQNKLIYRKHNLYKNNFLGEKYI